MFYEAAKNDHGLPHDPFKAIVTPRPIGWITTMSAKGEINLAPYSFFNAFSSTPPIVGFSSEGRKIPSRSWKRPASSSATSRPTICATR